MSSVKLFLQNAPKAKTDSKRIKMWSGKSAWQKKMSRKGEKKVALKKVLKMQISVSSASNSG